MISDSSVGWDAGEVGPGQCQEPGSDGGHLPAADLDGAAEFGRLALNVGPGFTDCQPHGPRARLGLRQQRHCLVVRVLGLVRLTASRCQKVTACFTVWPQLVNPREPDLVLFHGGGLVPSDTWWYCRRHHGARPDSERAPLRSAGRKVGRRPSSGGESGAPRRPRIGRPYANCATSKVSRSSSSPPTCGGCGRFLVRIPIGPPPTRWETGLRTTNCSCRCARCSRSNMIWTATPSASSATSNGFGSRRSWSGPG